LLFATSILELRKRHIQYGVYEVFGEYFEHERQKRNKNQVQTRI